MLSAHCLLYVICHMYIIHRNLLDQMSSYTECKGYTGHQRYMGMQNALGAADSGLEENPMRRGAGPQEHNSAIHKAGGFTVHGRSTGLPSIIHVEQKSVHWLSMGAAIQNTLQRPFCMASGCMVAL